MSRPSVLDVMQQGLAALGRRDWDALRTVCADDIVLRIPGRSPIAGETAGVEALVQRYQALSSGLGAADRPAELVDITVSRERAVVVQRNAFTLPGRAPVMVLMLVLAEVQDGRINLLQFASSEPHLVDEFWSRGDPVAPSS